MIAVQRLRAARALCPKPSRVNARRETILGSPINDSETIERVVPSSGTPTRQPISATLTQLAVGRNGRGTWTRDGRSSSAAKRLHAARRNGRRRRSASGTAVLGVLHLTSAKTRMLHCVVAGAEARAAEPSAARSAQMTPADSRALRVLRSGSE